MFDNLFYSLSGGANYRVFFIIYLALFIFTDTSLFEKIEPDQNIRIGIKTYLCFFLEIYVYQFFYFLYIECWWEISFTLHMLEFFCFSFYLQMKYKIIHPDSFIIFMVSWLLFYIIIEIYSV